MWATERENECKIEEGKGDRVRGRVKHKQGDVKRQEKYNLITWRVSQGNGI